MRSDRTLACADGCGATRGGGGMPLADGRVGKNGKRRRLHGPADFRDISANEGKSLRIVLADDHVVVRQGLKGLLEREGFAVVGEASDGFEAVRLTQPFRPEVAVLDFDMPLMNGIDAVTEKRQQSPRTGTS